MREPVAALHLSTFEDIVRREVRRIGRVPGLDRDDLCQEARIAAARALSLFDAKRQNTGRSFVATAVRNKLINVKRNAMTNGRVPHDARGRVTLVHSLDAQVPEHDETWLDRLSDPTPDADEGASARELVRALDARLSKNEMALLVSALVDGAKISTAKARGERINADDVERVRVTARDALLRMLGQRRMLTNSDHRVDRNQLLEDEMAKTTTTKVKLPVVKTEDLPECHASLPTGPGYDAKETGCRDGCPDKFSCVRDLVGDKVKNTGKLTLDVDTEVRAVLDGVITYDAAIERMKKRAALVESGGTVPDDLSTTKPIVIATETTETETTDAAEETATEVPSTATAATPIENTIDDEKKEDATMATKKTKSEKAPKAKAPKVEKVASPPKAAKPPKAPKAPKEKKSRAGVPRIPAKDRVAIYSEGHHRFLPQPRTLDAEQMAAALGRVKLGQTFDLTIGMEIVRKKRDGSEVVVKIAKDGFVMEGVTYPSLSAAGQWASKRAVSGNDFFNVTTYSCTEIRGKDVPSKVFSKQGEGKAAVVGAHGAKDDAEKPAKKAAAKKAAPAKAAKAKAPPPPKAPAKAAKKAPPPPPPAKKAAPKKAAKKAAKKK